MKLECHPSRGRNVSYYPPPINEMQHPNVFHRVIFPRKGPIRKSFKQRYEKGDPEIGTLGQPSGKYKGIEAPEV